MSDQNQSGTSGIPTNREGEPSANTKIGCVDGIKKSAKEAGNALMQQKLKSWQPVMSPRYVLDYQAVYLNLFQLGYRYLWSVRGRFHRCRSHYPCRMFCVMCILSILVFWRNRGALASL